MNEEPYGPIAVITPLAMFDEVMALASRLPFGLAGYAFTENVRAAALIGPALECSMVRINDRYRTADARLQGWEES